MSSNHVVMLCTVPDRGSGEQIGQALIEEHLAACVNIVPGLVSIYRWQGKVEQDQECLLVIKTTATRFEDVKECIRVRHPAELPEIIALPISQGETGYLDWITESVK